MKAMNIIAYTTTKLMEKKPIKRNGNIVKLSRDHHFALLFCWKIRNGLKINADPTRIKTYVKYFWETHMLPHFTQEETILFKPVNDSAVQKALDEHKLILSQVDGLETNESSMAMHLALLADTVENHVRYEERELFPHLEKLLTSEQLSNIGFELAAYPGFNKKDDFADEFWKLENAAP